MEEKRMLKNYFGTMILVALLCALPHIAFCNGKVSEDHFFADEMLEVFDFMNPDYVDYVREISQDYDDEIMITPPDASSNPNLMTMADVKDVQSQYNSYVVDDNAHHVDYFNFRFLDPAYIEYVRSLNCKEKIIVDQYMGYVRKMNPDKSDLTIQEILESVL